MQTHSLARALSKSVMDSLHPAHSMPLSERIFSTILPILPYPLITTFIFKKIFMHLTNDIRKDSPVHDKTDVDVGSPL